MSGRHRFGMFAKYWEPGQVKTRLAAGVGEQQATAIYKAFLDVQIARFGVLDQPQIVFSPDDRKSEFEEWLGEYSERWDLLPQGDGDLGNRMARFFQHSFDSQFEKATLVGSDTPTLPLSFLRQADQLLEIHDVVLGPTTDGGYYLVAAKKCVPPIFAEITWSTENVWQQTIDRLQEHRVRFAVLPTWYDVDNVDDLNRLRTEIRSMAKDDVLEQFQQQLDSILDSESR